jgi:hypothetical protein
MPLENRHVAFSPNDEVCHGLQHIMGYDKWLRPLMNSSYLLKFTP